VGHVIEDIKVGVQAFYQWQISLVGREGNKVSHFLAKYEIKHGENNLWHTTPPECIRDALLLEFSDPII
jgi:hypothetical protein